MLAETAPLELTRADVNVLESRRCMPGLGAILARRGLIVIVDEKKACENDNGNPKI